MSEFRLSFPLTIGGFDVFSPSNLFKLISLNDGINEEQVKSLAKLSENAFTDKIKTDLYLIFNDHIQGLKPFNVKFGDDGKSFDVKYNKSLNSSENEEWISLSKGKINNNNNKNELGWEGVIGIKGVNIIIEALEKELLETADNNSKDDNNKSIDPSPSEIKNKLISELKKVLLSPEEIFSNIKFIFTRKNLRTFKIPSLADNKKNFVIEQIDFATFSHKTSAEAKAEAPSKVPLKKFVYRSLSLEGIIPQGATQFIKQELFNKNKNVIVGGFPYLLKKIFTEKKEITEYHLFEE